MDDISPSDLKTILHSKRANLYYLQHCRVLVNGGRVEYVTDAGKQSLYWNIPIANTTTILLGTGTSITQAAMRELGLPASRIAYLRDPFIAAKEFHILISKKNAQAEALRQRIDAAILSLERDGTLARINARATTAKTP